MYACSQCIRWCHLLYSVVKVCNKWEEWPKRPRTIDSSSNQTCLLTHSFCRRFYRGFSCFPSVDALPSDDSHCLRRGLHHLRKCRRRRGRRGEGLPPGPDDLRPVGLGGRVGGGQPRRPQPHRPEQRRGRREQEQRPRQGRVRRLHFRECKSMRAIKE